MAQIARSGKFRLFDYGSAKKNQDVYGAPHPPDILEQYGCIGKAMKWVTCRQGRG
jgi:hypothetical protein